MNDIILNFLSLNQHKHLQNSRGYKAWYFYIYIRYRMYHDTNHGFQKKHPRDSYGPKIQIYNTPNQVYRFTSMTESASGMTLPQSNVVQVCWKMEWQQSNFLWTPSCCYRNPEKGNISSRTCFEEQITNLNFSWTIEWYILKLKAQKITI